MASAPAMAGAGGAFYLAGAVTTAAVAAGLGNPVQPAARAMWLLAALAALGGALLLWRGRRLPRWGFHLSVVLGIAMITAAVTVCPSFPGAMVVCGIYLLISVDAVVFFSIPFAVAYVAVSLLVEAVTLVLLPAPGPAPSIRWEIGLGLAVVGVALSSFVRILVQRASSASRDSLTGLANRRGFDDELAPALASAERTGQPLSVALLDVDHFKAVNDLRGHGAGDDLLRDFAGACVRALAPGALLARRGGDEFALLLPGTAGGAGAAVTEALRAACAAGDVRFSAGVAEHLPGERGGELLRRADAALYAAKAAGRGRTVVADADTDHLADDLAVALADGSVGVHLQPVVSLPDGSLAGVEALARWTHPDRGAVPPDVFVAVAEEAGLITDLGARVLAQACRDALALRSARGHDLFLSVNVSGRELVDPEYLTRVTLTLHETGWSPADLVVEVTESLLEATTETALRTLADLRAMGVRVAIDDFGTGYSAFARLDVLPADYLKLDHSFVAAITTSPRRVAMLRAVLGLAAALGLGVIAEGVEDADQAALLTRLGCPLVQGYHYARPSPVGELVERLRPAARLRPRRAPAPRA